MAFAGVFITWGFANISLLDEREQATLLYGSGVSSESMPAAPATSATSAPANPGNKQVILSIAASAPIYFTVGPNAVAPASPPANVTNGSAARYYDPTSGPLDIVVNGSDKMAWRFGMSFFTQAAAAVSEVASRPAPESARRNGCFYV